MQRDPLFSFNPGPRPFQPILRSPHKAHIDRLLFEERVPVLRVHAWLTEVMNDNSISYVMLTRYKKSVLNGPRSDDEVRREEVRRDLATLGEMVRKGEALLRENLQPKASDVLSAIELRAHILATFPDASDRIHDEAYRHVMRLAAIVLAVVTDEQREEIRRRLLEQLPSEATQSDAA